MDGYRDPRDGPRQRWRDDDLDWDSGAPLAPPADAYPVPDQRGPDEDAAVGAGYPPGAGDDVRRLDPPEYGRYAEAEPRAPGESSFPGFEPRRRAGGPAAPPGAGPRSVPPAGAPVGGPTAYPIVTPVSAPAGDPTSTAERPAVRDAPRALDAPTSPVTPIPPRPDVRGEPPGDRSRSAGGTPTSPGGPGPLGLDEASAGGARFHAEPIDRAALRRPAGPAAPVGDGVYRTRRPAVAAVAALVTLVLEVPALRLLADGAFGGPAAAGRLLAGVFLALGLPAFAAGLYALVTGAARVPDQRAAAAWLRTPLAYLPVSLLLFLAAAIAT